MKDDEIIPGFNLSAKDGGTLWNIVDKYGPFQNGTTAVYWHIVGIISQARKKPPSPNPGYAGDPP